MCGGAFAEGPRRPWSGGGAAGSASCSGGKERLCCFPRAHACRGQPHSTVPAVEWRSELGSPPLPGTCLLSAHRAVVLCLKSRLSPWPDHFPGPDSWASCRARQGQSLCLRPPRLPAPPPRTGDTASTVQQAQDPASPHHPRTIPEVPGACAISLSPPCPAGLFPGRPPPSASAPWASTRLHVATSTLPKARLCRAMPQPHPG